MTRTGIVKRKMDKKKIELDFIHSFIPPRPEESGAGTAARRLKTEGKTITTFLLLHGTGGNEQDLIPLAYELDKKAAILSPRGKVLLLILVSSSGSMSIL